MIKQERTKIELKAKIAYTRELYLNDIVPFKEYSTLMTDLNDQLHDINNQLYVYRKKYRMTTEQAENKL